MLHSKAFVIVNWRFYENVYMKRRLEKYIMDTFECWYHGVDIPSTFDAPVYSSTSHLSKNLLESKTLQITELS